MLLAAGHAPAFPERSLDEPELPPARAGLDLILTAHEPYPAVAFDRAWNLVAANSAVGVLTLGVDSALLAPPANVVRISLHPRGIAPRIINLGEVPPTYSIDSGDSRSARESLSEVIDTVLTGFRWPAR